MNDEEQMALNMEAQRTARRRDYIYGLRELARFLEDNPIVPCPIYDTINVFVDRETIAKVARIGGRWEKEYQGAYFILTRRFGEDLKLDLNIARHEVCRKVVTGTRTVPATEAVPAVPEHEEPVEEWICDEVSLLAEAKE